MSWRDLMCGDPRRDHVGRSLTLAGWAARRRDHGGLVFVDLRDRTGITQLVINPERSPAAAALAREIRNEFVLQARGELVARSAETVNARNGDRRGRARGRRADDRLALDAASLPARRGERRRDAAPPLPLARSAAGEAPARTSGSARRWSGSSGATWRRRASSTSRRRSSTSRHPEGARDFVVPSRLHKGRFFALPQSPQILKQLTMIAGFDRYYQIAICFRDEDLRADRVQEITQLDVEMAFPEREVLFRVMEEMFAAIWRECLGVEIDDAVAAADVRGGRPPVRIRQAGHALRARARGRDRGDPRLRVRRLRGRGGSAVPARAPHVHPRGARRSRSSRRSGARRASRTVMRDEAARCARRSRSSSRERSSRPRTGAGETLLFAAGTWAVTSRVLGHLRLHLGRELGLVDDEAFTFLWVTDFPMFEWDEDEGALGAVHHPFTRPTDEWRDRFEDDPRRRARVRLRHHRERQRARRRLVPDPRARPPGTRLRPARAHARTSSARSSASCSTRSRWARRRTAVSRSGSTG